MTLAGRRVVNTRAAHQAAALDALLLARGAIPVRYPCIAIALPPDTAALDEALTALAAGEYDLLALTSTNTVLMLEQRLRTLKLTLPRVRTAAVGEITARAAEQLGLRVETVPEAYIAEGLAAALGDLTGQRVLLPESALARPVLPELLRISGARVDVVTAYVNVPASGGEDVPRQINAGTVDAVVFTSGSIVTNFIKRVTREGGDHDALARVCAACIGPQTAQAAVRHGLRVDVQPVIYTLDALVAALDDYFAHSADR